MDFCYRAHNLHEETTVSRNEAIIRGTTCTLLYGVDDEVVPFLTWSSVPSSDQLND